MGYLKDFGQHLIEISFPMEFISGHIIQLEIFIWKSINALMVLCNSLLGDCLVLYKFTLGITSWIVTYPFDTMKTIIQTSTLGESSIRQIDLIKKIKRENGLTRIFKGINASLIYAFSLNSAIFYGNEFSHFYLDKYIKNL